jgi:hypothetical protein
LNSALARSCTELFDPAACWAEERQRSNGLAVAGAVAKLNVLWLDDPAAVLLVVVVAAKAPVVVGAAPVGTGAAAAGAGGSGNAATSFERAEVARDRSSATE